MRPGQNKRMRGRNNNNNNGGGNRKGPNPLTRSYESNGPDVKIRGTAQHIGEKYLQLARDAQTSGDPVAAESYLQHAEHYFRIIAAAQQAQYQSQAGYVRQPGDLEPEDDGDDDDGIPDRFALPSERTPQPPVPVQQPPVAAEPRSQGQERAESQDRPYRQDRFNGDREPRQERGSYERPAQYDRQAQPDRNNFDRDRPQRNDRNGNGGNRNRFGQDGAPREGGQRDTRDMQYREQPRIPAIQPVEARQPDPAPVTDAGLGAELPAFITAPVRVVAPSVEPVSAPEPVDAAPARMTPPEPADAAPEGYALRPRRRRRTRLVAGLDGDPAPENQPEPTPEE